MQVPLRLLSTEDMQAIHNAALTVLAETGMLVDQNRRAKSWRPRARA